VPRSPWTFASSGGFGLSRTRSVRAWEHTGLQRGIDAYLGAAPGPEDSRLSPEEDDDFDGFEEDVAGD
jgi:hypothetical protein